jgi:hypothetical protein
MFNKDLYPTVDTFKYPKLERKNRGGVVALCLILLLRLQKK